MLKTLLTDTLETGYEESGDPAFGPVVLLHWAQSTGQVNY